VKTVTITNLKGGSAKTTSTAYLAHAFAAMGRRVMAIDADPQGSLLRWSEVDGWVIPTTGLPVRNLHVRLAATVPPGTEVVLIDTPPLDEAGGIVYSALRAADVVIVTMAPTTSEYERLADVWAAIEEVETLRDGPPAVAVLLNRTVANATSTATFRQLIEDGGHHVLTATIPRREAIAQAFAGPVTSIGPYADAAAEIDQMESAR
jgi:chromosome partitioning protein